LLLPLLLFWVCSALATTGLSSSTLLCPAPILGLAGVLPFAYAAYASIFASVNPAHPLGFICRVTFPKQGLPCTALNCAQPCTPHLSQLLCVLSSLMKEKPWKQGTSFTPSLGHPGPVGPGIQWIPSYYWLSDKLPGTKGTSGSNRDPMCSSKMAERKLFVSWPREGVGLRLKVNWEKDWHKSMSS
jgi:hypothetical protein